HLADALAEQLELLRVRPQSLLVRGQPGESLVPSRHPHALLLQLLAQFRVLRILLPVPTLQLFQTPLPQGFGEKPVVERRQRLLRLLLRRQRQRKERKQDGAKFHASSPYG